MLGVLHLRCEDSLSPTQAHMLAIVSAILAQFHSVSSRSVWIHSFPPKFIQSQPDPRNLAQICSYSLRFLQSHTDLLSFMQFHTDSLIFTKFHTVSCRFTYSRSNNSDPFSCTQIRSDSLSLAPDSLCFPQTQSDSLRFIQIRSHSLRPVA